MIRVAHSDKTNAHLDGGGTTLEPPDFNKIQLVLFQCHPGRFDW